MIYRHTYSCLFKEINDISLHLNMCFSNDKMDNYPGIKSIIMMNLKKET